jgi:hypothetical protein
MELNRWYYITYLKKGNTLSLWYDGVKDSESGLAPTVYNTGPIYIGKDPWYGGLNGAGYDNIQIHKRALTEDEIERTAAG